MRSPSRSPRRRRNRSNSTKSSNSSSSSSAEERKVPKKQRTSSRDRNKRDRSRGPRRSRERRQNDKKRSLSPRKRNRSSSLNKKRPTNGAGTVKKWEHDMYYEDVPQHDHHGTKHGYDDRRKHEERTDFQGKDEDVGFMDARRYNRELIGAMGIETVWGKSPAKALDDSSADDSTSVKEKVSKKHKKDKKKKSKKSSKSSKK